MANILLAILIGWAFDRVQMLITAPNYGSMFNGFGAIDLTYKKEIKAPMAYRVLVPMLVIGFEKLFKTDIKYRSIIYQNIKVFFVIVAAWSVIYVFGVVAALLTFTILLATIQYDYWDWPIELAAVVLAAGGHFFPALIVGVLYAFSRETAPIIGLIYFVATKDVERAFILTALIVSIMSSVRAVVGKRPLYCDRVMIKTNLNLFKNFLKWKPFAYSTLFTSVVITAGTVLSVVVNPEYWYSLIFIGAGWVLAKADEPRIFSACVPFIAVMIGGLI